MNNYTKLIINREARLSGTVLGRRHMEILNYTFKYYKKNKKGPTVIHLLTQLKTSKKEINAIFPNGLLSVYSWVGIPVQTHQADSRLRPRVVVNKKKDVYLDHNTTTSIRPEIRNILKLYNSGRIGFANPGNPTRAGGKAHNQIELAREKIAMVLGVNPLEIGFTGSGSEANNLLIKGIALKKFEKRGHIVTTKIEHRSVIRTVEWLEKIGYEAAFVDVGPEGIVNPRDIARSLKENTILVSVMAVNNEIGTLNPLKEIGKICKKRNIPFIVDAVQGVGKIKLKPAEWGITGMTFSGHKIHAPKGCAGYYLNRNHSIEPLVHGGYGEPDHPGDSENVGGIITLGEAVRLADKERNNERIRLKRLRDWFLKELTKICPGLEVNGSSVLRSPWNLSVNFPAVDNGLLLLLLNKVGITVSLGTAYGMESHVLKALGRSSEGTIRFSFGLQTNREELEYVLRSLSLSLKELRKMKRKITALGKSP